MKKAVAYMRYSSDNQSETSIEHQRAAIIAYCLRNKIVIEREYVDEAFTATNDKRPAFQQMIRDAQNSPDWSMILVYDLSRYSRNVTNSIKYKNMLKDLRIDLISVTQDFGTGNEAFLLENITHLLNDFYSRNNSKVTHAGMTVKAKKAGHCGGTPPLGYTLDPNGSLLVDEYEAEIVRKVFHMFEYNYSYEKMARILNESGYKTKAGKPFTKHSFYNLLTQEKYTGTFVWNKARPKDSRDKYNSHAYRPVDQQIRIDGGCPSIIDPERFHAVQETLAARAMGKACSKRRHHYVLSGLKILKCANCGSYLIGTARSSHGKHFTTYSCPNHNGNHCPTKEIRTKNLDAMVVGLLIQDLRQRNDLPTISRILSHNDDYHRLLAKKRGNDKAIANLTKAIEASYSESLINKLNKLEQEKISLTRAIATSTTTTFEVTPENVKVLCKKFGKFLLTSEDPDVKNYLITQVQEILVSNDNVTITLKIA